MPLSTWSRGIRIRENGALTVVPSVVTGSGRDHAVSERHRLGRIGAARDAGRQIGAVKAGCDHLVSVRGQ